VTTTNAPNPWLLRIVGLAGLVVAISAVIGAVIFAQEGAWMPAAFRAVIILAGALGALMGLGRFKHAPAMGAFCVASTFMIAGVLGYLAGGGDRALLTGNPGAFDSGEPAHLLLIADLGGAAVVGAIAGLFALGRDPKRSWPRLGVGVLLALPVLIGAVAVWKLDVIQRIASLNAIIATVLFVALFLIAVGLIAASAHAFINAFGAGLPDLDNVSEIDAADAEMRATPGADAPATKRAPATPTARAATDA